MQLIKMAAILMTTTFELAAQDPVQSPATSPIPERRIVVSLADHKLVFLQNGEVKRIYTVAVGKATTPSPTGQFHVTTRIVNPTWFTPGKVVGPGPSNPLGNRWIGLNHKGYGIHGTNVPSSIGKSASHGCIRMRKADVEELFTLIQIGDLVEMQQDVEPLIAQLLHPAERMANAASVVSVGGAE